MPTTASVGRPVEVLLTRLGADRRFRIWNPSTIAVWEVAFPVVSPIAFHDPRQATGRLFDPTYYRYNINGLASVVAYDKVWQ
jgi:hypothetical protein